MRGRHLQEVVACAEGGSGRGRGWLRERELRLAGRGGVEGIWEGAMRGDREGTEGIGEGGDGLTWSMLT